MTEKTSEFEELIAIARRKLDFTLDPKNWESWVDLPGILFPVAKRELSNADSKERELREFQSEDSKRLNELEHLEELRLNQEQPPAPWKSWAELGHTLLDLKRARPYIECEMKEVILGSVTASQLLAVTSLEAFVNNSAKELLEKHSEREFAEMSHFAKWHHITGLRIFKSGEAEPYLKTLKKVIRRRNKLVHFKERRTLGYVHDDLLKEMGLTVQHAKECVQLVERLVGLVQDARKEAPPDWLTHERADGMKSKFLHPSD